MKQLIIISQAPLTPQIKRNSYVEEFINAGYADTQFWDVSQYLHAGIKLKDEIQAEYIQYIYNIHDLIESLNKVNINNCIFIIDFPQTLKTKELFQTLSDHKCIYVRIDMYANTYLYISKWKQISKLFSKSIIQIISSKIQALIYSFYAKKHKIAPFKRYYSSSSLNKVSRTDKINHPDYEEFKFSPSNRIIKGNYIVFIDTYFGYHPDDKYIHKFKNTKASPQEYHKSLIRFFTYLEQEYKMPVVIAAHPKSDYSPDTFGNRQIIKYKTKDLILFADKVILQLCNSISWVTLANKPLLFITTNGYNSFTQRKNRLYMLAQILNTNVFNIDTCNWDNIKFKTIDSSARLNYIYTYLTDKEIESKKNIELLTNSFETL